MHENHDDNRPDLDDIDYWIFDLDNTLYPHEANLFTQVDHKMGLFIQDMFDISYDDAKKRQKNHPCNRSIWSKNLIWEY